MPFEIRNHFKTPGVSVLHLASISLFQLAFLSTELETHFHRLFSLPTSGPKHRRPYLMRCDIPVAREPGRRAAHGSLALPAFSPPHFLPGGCSRALSQEMLSASCTCNTRQVTALLPRRQKTWFSSLHSLIKPSHIRFKHRLSPRGNQKIYLSHL